MSNTKGLLPCPFCGSQPINAMHGGKGRIACTNADCFGPYTTAANVEDAIAQWNKRPRPDVLTLDELHALNVLADELDYGRTHDALCKLLLSVTTSQSRTDG